MTYPELFVSSAAAAVVVAATIIAIVTNRARWRAIAAVIGGIVMVAGLALHAGVAIIAGFLGLLAVSFHYALRELGALEAPEEPRGVMESGPDILSVDLRDRE